MIDYHPISSVLVRKSKKKQSQQPKPHTMYPLRKTSTVQETYDYENIKNSIIKWYSYSTSVGNNWNKLMRLYESVSSLGTPEQLKECTNIINLDIIPYIQSPSMFKKDIYKKLNECKSETNKKLYGSILNTINENLECDRLLSNFDTISRRFNIDKLISNNILYEDAVEETLYSLCSLIDTYDMDWKSKFCVASEAALYSIYNTITDDILEEEYMKDKLSNTAVLETVLDYFLINYGRNNVPKFLDEITDACSKDAFIGKQLDPYIKYLKELDSPKDEILVEEEEQSSNNEDLYGLSKEPDQFKSIRDATSKIIGIKDSFSQSLQQAKDMLTKMKLTAQNSMEILKSAIRSLLVTRRAEDLVKGTHNALAYIFYAVITLGLFGIGGPLAGLFGLAANYTISQTVQKEYLKSAIQEWRKHRQSIVRKINDSSDSEKKRRLEAYLMQLDKTIKVLDDHYNEIKDKTTTELKKQADDDKITTGSTDIDPSGNRLDFDSETTRGEINV